MKEIFYKLGAQAVMTAVMLLLVLSPFQALLAQAQATEPTAGDTNPAIANLVQQANASVPAAQATAAAATPTTPAATTPPGGGIPATADIGCNFSNLIPYVSDNAGGTFALCLTNVVYIFTVGIGSGFAYVAAYFFDLATQLSLNGTAYALGFVSTGWTTARDLANMAFLFILLFIAFQIMFSVDTSSTQSTLAAVIVIALLVNFSFFFTRLVIDAGNILSIEFYNSIQAPPLSTTTAAAGITSGNLPGSSTGAAIASYLGQNGTTKDLTANIMGMLQLQNLFNTNSFKQFFTGVDPTTGNQTNPAAGFMVTAIALTFLYIAAGIMFWLLSIMFITTGIKFLTRIVVLWFLIIFSPLAFVARAIPQFRKYFDQWRGLLVSHAFYPVAFMFIFLILTNFASQLSCTVNGTAVSNCTGLIQDVFNGLSSTANSSSAVAAIGYAVANVGIRLGFVIAILYLGMQAAQSVSVMGASGAAKAGNWFGGKLKSSTLGLASRTGGLAYRYSGGLLADKSINYLKKNPRTSSVGQYLDYSWRKNVLTPLAGAKVGGVSSYIDVKKARDERKKDLDANKRDADTREMERQAPALNTELQTLEQKKKDHETRVELDAKASATVFGGPPLTPDEDKRLKAIIARGAGADLNPAEKTRKAELEKTLQETKERVNGLSDRELETHSIDDLKNNAFLMTEKQVERIAKLGKFTDQEKADLKKAWVDSTQKTIDFKVNDAKLIIEDNIKYNRAHPTTPKKLTEGVSDRLKKSVQGLDKQELENMHTEDLKVITPLLSEKQKDKFDDLQNVPPQVREEIKNLWEEEAADSPLQKTLKKLEDIAAVNADADTRIKTAKRTNWTIDSNWSKELKEVLTKERNDATKEYNSDRTDAVKIARWQNAQEALNTYKEFEDNRKKIEPNININSLGAKGTFKGTLIK